MKSPFDRNDGNHRKRSSGSQQDSSFLLSMIAQRRQATDRSERKQLSLLIFKQRVIERGIHIVNLASKVALQQWSWQPALKAASSTVALRRLPKLLMTPLDLSGHMG